ncbi:Arrestin domain-containing protein 2 [Trichoplax sp. H2]|nr:Arrestin domain-containing protein 2 [Trichoplax sp. H2]|eukprot:RDD41389.1 Arrestin domain-containing protein 2 [Trichoplax sp. H2]
MVKIEVLKISIVDDQEVFYPGQSIEGVVHLQLNQPLQLKFLRLKLCGRSQSKLKLNHTGHGTTTHRDEELFHSDVMILIGKAPYFIAKTGDGSCYGGKIKFKENFDRNEIAPKIDEGSHDFPFRFVLPDGNIPASYEDRNGNNIGYFVEARIRRPWKVDEVAQKIFNVKEIIDCNLPEYNVKNFDRNEIAPKIDEGSHDFPFRFVLPDGNIPASYEDRNGNNIGYFVEARIRRPWKVDEVAQKIFNVKEIIDCNLPEYNVQPPPVKKEWKLYSLLNKNKPIILTASTDRLAYFPGERIEILDTKVVNGSSRTLTNVKLEFIQKITYKAREHKLSRRKCFRCKSSNQPIKPDEVFDWPNLSVVVPAASPTLDCNTLITVKYFIKITVMVPYSFNQYIKLPVIIGTVPLRYDGQLPPTYEEAQNAENTPDASLPNYFDCVERSIGYLDFDVSNLYRNKDKDEMLPRYPSVFPTEV